MTFDEAYKIYKRFLKDEGIFRRALEIHSECRHLNEHLIKKKLFLTMPSQWIQSCGTFCQWCRSPEGDKFWWPISILWQIKCLQQDIIIEGFTESKTNLNNDIKYGISSYIKWASGSGFTGEHYNRLMEYKKENNI